MVRYLLISLIVFLGFLLLGCIDEGPEQGEVSDDITVGQEDTTTAETSDTVIQPPEPPYSGTPNKTLKINDADACAELSVESISTDKEVYHSAETLTLTVSLYSISDIENISVLVNGLNNRIDEQRIVNLTRGSNELIFAYALPRCNVCGGIREGNYTIGITVMCSADNTSIANDSVTVRILQ